MKPKGEESSACKGWMLRGRPAERVCIIIMTVFLIACDGKTIISKRSTDSNDKSTTGGSSQLDEAPVGQPRLPSIPAANPSFEAAFQGECGKNNNDNPCEHICLDLHDGTYECSCFYGFTLAVDGYSCPPIPAPSVSSPGSSSSSSSAPGILNENLEAPERSLSSPSTPSSDNRLGRREPDKRNTLQEASGLSLDKQHQTTISGSDNFSTQLPPRSRQVPTDSRVEFYLAANDNRKLLVGASGKGNNNNNNNKEQLAVVGELDFSASQAQGDIGDSLEGEEASNSERTSGGILGSPTKWKNRLLGNRQPGGSANLISPLGLENRKADKKLRPRYKDARLDVDKAQASINKAAGGSGPSEPSEEPYADEFNELTGDKSQQDGQSDDDNLTLTYSAGYEDMIDPDIRSIMSNNDKLVRNLATTISGSLPSFAATIRRPPSGNNQEEEKLEEKPKRDSNFDKVYYDLSLLEELVSATIENYNRTENRKTLRPLKWSSSGKINQSSGDARRRRHLDKDPNKRSTSNFDGSLCEKKDNNFDHENPALDFKDCNDMPEDCDSGGRCIVEQLPLPANFKPQKRARCQCPLGRGGLLCQKPLQRIVPRFTGHSYLALPMATDNQLTTLRLLFKPEVERKQLLVDKTNHRYNNQANQETLLLHSNSFLLLLDQYSRVELRYSTRQSNDSNYDDKTILSPRVQAFESSLGEVTRVIGSRDIILDGWNELIVTDATNDFTRSQSIQTPSATNKIILVTPEKIDLVPKGTANSSGQELFVGGLPHNDLVDSYTTYKTSGSNLGSFTRGFSGCIKEFSINDRLYNLSSDFRGDALDGFDIGSSETSCPRRDDIKPCTCNDEGLQCLQLNDTHLDYVFKGAPNIRKAIRRIWIYQTNLTTLKRDAFGDYIIRDLYLDLNQIQTVERGAFGKATETLQTISLSRNLLTSFPFQELQSMIGLKQIGLGHNRLTKVSAQEFGSSNSLESIDLSNNLISSIEGTAFSQLHQITMLDLSKNLLSKVATDSLLVKSSQRSLMISLRANQISSLAADTFGGYHPLSLDLSRNQLTYLDEYVFAPLLMNNTFINVAENPFSCYGCQLYRWLLEFDRDYLNNLDNFSCPNDESLMDLTLESIGCK